MISTYLFKAEKSIFVICLSIVAHLKFYIFNFPGAIGHYVEKQKKALERK